MENNKSIFEQIMDWTSNSVSLKLFIIGIIALLLLIPQAFISELIDERQKRLHTVEEEVSQKWSSEQTLVGPYLSVPYLSYTEVENGSETKRIKESKMLYFFPDELHVNGMLEAQELRRGIYDVVVYNSELSFTASFEQLAIQKLFVEEGNIQWQQAKLHLSIADMRGISMEPVIKINSEIVGAEPYFDAVNNARGLQINMNEVNRQSAFEVTADIKLKGSKGLFFSPVGKNTTVSLAGDWPDPSFQGDFLPTSRTINENGFQSEWRVLHFNRPYGQEFIDRLPDLKKNVLGMHLSIAADQYQNSSRTAKYALLIIVLSFMAMFMMEIISKRKIHPLQYILVGLSLVLYYTLLIALSEHIGFNWAYLIAALATILLLAVYIKSVLNSRKNSILFTAILSVFYIFIFILTKEQDYALLIGSIGLFIVLAASMLASRKMDWYQQKTID